MFLPGESQGQGSLVGCRLWGHTESDTTEVTTAAAAESHNIIPKLSKIQLKITDQTENQENVNLKEKWQSREADSDVETIGQGG